MKRLIVCCDGTWQDAEASGIKTNVGRLVDLIPLTGDDGIAQKVEYLAGVGTGSDFNRLVGGLAGVGLTQNVFNGYNALARDYDPGDEIYLFGFSRGAYTARAIAGMIGDMGLMENENALELVISNLLPARECFENGFRRWLRHNDISKHCTEPVHKGVTVECIGVWDTVGALGIPTRIDALDKIRAGIFEFHNTELGGHVKHAFHALAIDEKRRYFAPTLWTGEKPAGTQTVEQVWFPGVHSDIGGGYEEVGLADVTLRWMASRVEETTGLRFARRKLVTIKGNFAGLLHENRLERRYALDLKRPDNRTVISPKGKRAPLGESVHRSAFLRFQTVAPFEDTRGRRVRGVYEPGNLAPALGVVGSTGKVLAPVRWGVRAAWGVMRWLLARR